MQRVGLTFSPFLARFSHRASLALSHPLLAAYSPLFAARDLRSLHIFVRRDKNYAEVEVKDGATVAGLQKAVAAELMIDAAPDRIRLLQEGEGGVLKLLDSCKKLADEGVGEGSKVVAEVIALDTTPSSLPPLISMASDPLVSPFMEYRGLIRSEKHSQFYRAALTTQPGPLCAASGTRTWRLLDPKDPSKALKWPFLGANVLMERDFYSRFLCEEGWLNNFSGATQCTFAVLGQPGIGKSAFGIWLLTQLLRSERTVVYSRNFTRADSAALDVQHFVFHRGVAFKTDTVDLGPTYALLQDPSVIHLCDSIKPQGETYCHKVLITSPDPRVWRWFVLKEYAGTAYFPLYDYAELEALRGAEFGDTLSPETLALRVRAWGPSTRAVFSSRQREVGADILCAMSEKSLEELQRAMSEVRAPTGGAGSDTPHALFTLQADRETLRSGGITFRSEAVAQRVGRQVALRNRDTIIPTLLRFLGSSVTRSVAGTVFEMAALDVLGRGGCGEYPVRPLLPHTVGAAKKIKGAAPPLPWQTLPAASSIQRFDSLPQLARRCGEGGGTWSLRTQCFIPTSPNLASVDMIGPGLQLFQVTANRSSHDLKVTSGRSEDEGLLALYRTLLPLFPERWEAAQPHLDVCFVVPEGCGKGWKAQKLVVYKPRSPSYGMGGAGNQHSGRTSPTTATGNLEPPEVNVVDVEGGGTGFSFAGKVVEVRQHIMELPESLFDKWLEAPVQGLDDIDLAKES